MMPIDRSQDDLPATLIDIADERMPDYVDDLLGRTAAMRQRPAWAFPGRWLPMVDLTVERRLVPRLPWRVLAIAALLVLLMAGAVWFAGSRRHVPASFGPAANGSIAYASGGDLFVGEPATGQSRLLLGGSDADSSPLFSPDGLRLAFLRAGSATGYDLMVIGTDGSNPVKLSTTPLTDGATFQWGPDSASLIVPTRQAIWSASTPPAVRRPRSLTMSTSTFTRSVRRTAARSSPRSTEIQPRSCS